MIPDFVNYDDNKRFAQLNSVYLTGAQFTSMAVGFTPIDSAKDLADFIKGKDTLTGEEINRWLLAACIVTPEIVDLGIKQYGKNADNIAAFIKSGGKNIWTMPKLSKVPYEFFDNTAEHIFKGHIRNGKATG